jgi:hypothetical protein
MRASFGVTAGKKKTCARPHGLASPPSCSVAVLVYQRFPETVGCRRGVRLAPAAGMRLAICRFGSHGLGLRRSRLIGAAWDVGVEVAPDGLPDNPMNCSSGSRSSSTGMVT